MKIKIQLKILYFEVDRSLIYINMEFQFFHKLQSQSIKDLI
jgi:hypothetical protein